mgnify:CR=1 FL=1
MKKIKNILLILSIFISANIYSQVSCGTPQNSTVQHFPSGDSGFSPNATPICVNVQFHIVRTTTGTGGASVGTLDQVNNLLNSHLNPHNIFVNKIGFDYINNSAYYDMTDAQFNSLVALNNNPNAINFYIINSCTNWIGRAGSITSRNLVMQNSYCTTGVSAHEFGHCLNLWHTFQGTASGTSGCAELINGSNCATCGDYVCDTPADANIGATNGYNPDLTNDMSYSPPSSLTHFSILQGNRMRDALNGSSVLQPIIGNLCKSIIGSSVLCSSPNQSYSLSNSLSSNAIWSVSSNLQIVSQNGQTVIIRPLSNSINGSATITATFSNGQILTKTIWIGKPSFQFVYSYFQPQPVKSTLCIESDIPNFSLDQQGVTTVNFYNFGSTTAKTKYSKYCIRATLPCVTVTATNACGTTTLDYLDGCTMRMANPNKTFKVFPNPSKDIVSIELQDIDNQPKNEYKITGELFDLTGISTSKVEIKDNKAMISVQGLNKGIYVLKIYINDEVETHQIAVE